MDGVLPDVTLQFVDQREPFSKFIVNGKPTQVTFVATTLKLAL